MEKLDEKPGITVYTTDPCARCIRAKDLLRLRGLEYEEVNLDKDPVGRRELAALTDLEQVIPQETCLTFAGGASSSACTPDQFEQRRIVVEDTCNGAPYAKAISSAQEAVIKLEVSNFTDITDRPEIFFDLRSGAALRACSSREHE